jgi:hypothetical protein
MSDGSGMTSSGEYVSLPEGEENACDRRLRVSSNVSPHVGGANCQIKTTAKESFRSNMMCCSNYLLFIVHRCLYETHKLSIEHRASIIDVALDCWIYLFDFDFDGVRWPLILSGGGAVVVTK